MTNPRIVRRRRDGHLHLAVRGVARDTVFQIEVGPAALELHPPEAVEDRLVEEAESLLRRAGAEDIDWAALRFTRDPEHGTWRKELTDAELDRLMGS